MSVTKKQKACKHMNFFTTANITRLEEDARFIVAINIKCTDCDLPFLFYGMPRGYNLNQGTVSTFGDEANLPITPKGVEPPPLPLGGISGFSVEIKP